MKVISTDPRASLPRKEGWAEIPNSSLGKYSELTLCARFLTYHFSTDATRWPSQSLISYGLGDLLGSYVARPCDQSFRGCTEEYKNIFSDAQLAWISGSVFGYCFVSNTPQFYPAWWPAVWNTACLTASPHLGTFRIRVLLSHWSSSNQARLSLVQLQPGSALIGPELQSVEIFS